MGMPRNQEVEAETDRVAGDEQEMPAVSADSGELLAAQRGEIERESGGENGEGSVGRRMEWSGALGTR